MEFLRGHWFDLLQSGGIVASLLLSAYTFWRDEKAVRISNLIEITQQYRNVWSNLYDQPKLSRVLSKDADLEREPVSHEEEMFVTTLIFHLGATYEAMKAGMFERLQGLKRDVREFLSLPIPKAVWKKFKPLQNKRLVEFVEAALRMEV